MDNNALAAAMRLAGVKNQQPQQVGIVLDTPQGKLFFPQVAVHLFTDQSLEVFKHSFLTNIAPELVAMITQSVLEKLREENNEK
jgi:hypothetical protein